MAKDPAFLFYPGDWHLGTMTLTRHQKGCYMDLLMAQFSNGPLSLDTIKTILGQDQAVWTVLQCKFRQTAKGLWFNERLATEKLKRENYCKSRREIRNKGTTYDKSYDSHTLQRMENRNENKNFGKTNPVTGGGLGEPRPHAMTAAEMFDPDLPKKVFEKHFSTAQSWFESVAKNNSVSVSEIKKSLREFLQYANDSQWLPGKSEPEIKRYFLNCLKKEKKPWQSNVITERKPVNTKLSYSIDKKK